MTLTPYALATVDGHFAKTNKALCMNKIMSDEEDVYSPPVDETLAIVDGNATLYMKEVPVRMGQIADKVLKMLPKAAEVIFSTDSYGDNSIKASERSRRGCGEKLIITGDQTKQPADWSDFLSNDENKEQLIHLIAQRWESKLPDLEGSPIIFIEKGDATRISSEGIERIPHLDSTQEETDTRVVLYIDYAKHQGFKFVRVKTKDSDIFFLLLHYARKYTIQIIYDNGTHLINVSNITQDNTQEWCTAMMGLHCFTGVDTTSAFKGKGKIKPFNVLKKSTKFSPVMAKLGDEWQVQDGMVDQLEEFCCVLYGHKRLKSVDDVRDVKLKKVCGRDGLIKTTSVDLSYFPPCKRSLLQHIKRCNYQVAIWKCSHIAKPAIPPPGPEYGWTLNENTDKLEPLWFEGNPIPQSLLELMVTTPENVDDTDEDIEFYYQSEYETDGEDGNDY